MGGFRGTLAPADSAFWLFGPALPFPGGVFYGARRKEVPMQAVLIIIQLIVSVALIGVVLLQKSEGGALGMGGGGGGGLGSMFSPRGAADTLTRTTAILALLFFLSSLGLTMLALHGRPQGSIIDSSPGSASQPTAPLRPVAPRPSNPTPAIPAPH
jgi:preprotein translocase subunit SecG